MVLSSLWRCVDHDVDINDWHDGDAVNGDVANDDADIDCDGHPLSGS